MTCSQGYSLTMTAHIVPLDVYGQKLMLLGRTTDQMRQKAATTFSGPSIELHLWALEAREELDIEAAGPQRRALLRAIYAVLPAWGMHRMGDTPTKMPDFATFEAGIERAWLSLKSLWEAKPPLSGEQWERLEQAYRSISARSESTGSQIVSRSKVLAHLLPDVCAPVDREYTLSFFGIKKCHDYRVRHWNDYEWKLYRELHDKFFHVAPSDPRCQRLLDVLVGGDKFSTSHMKTLDNLIVANT